MNEPNPDLKTALLDRQRAIDRAAELQEQVRVLREALIQLSIAPQSETARQLRDKSLSSTQPKEGEQ